MGVPVVITSLALSTALLGCSLSGPQPPPAGAHTQAAVGPGYVEFYTDHSRSDDSTAIHVYRVVEGEREAHLGRVVRGIYRGQGVSEVPAGEQLFVLRSGPAMRLIRARVEPGMLTPVEVIIDERDLGSGFEITTTYFELAAVPEPPVPLPSGEDKLPGSGCVGIRRALAACSMR